MKALFHHSRNEKQSYGTNLKTSEVHDAITLHPIKETKRMNKLYVYFLELTAQELIKISKKLASEIQETTKLLFRLTNQDMNNSVLVQNSSTINSNASFVFGTSSMSSSTPEKLSSFTFTKENFSFWFCIFELTFLEYFLELQQFLPKRLDYLVNWDFYDGQIYSLYDGVEQKRTDLLYRSVVQSLVKQINKYYHDNETCEVNQNHVAYVYSTVDSILGQTLILNVGSCASKFRTTKKQKQFYAQLSFIEMRIKQKEDKEDSKRKFV